MLVNNMPRRRLHVLFYLKLVVQYWDNCDPDSQTCVFHYALLTAFILLHIHFFVHVYKFAFKYILETCMLSKTQNKKMSINLLFS